MNILNFSDFRHNYFEKFAKNQIYYKWIILFSVVYWKASKLESKFSRPKILKIRFKAVFQRLSKMHGRFLHDHLVQRLKCVIRQWELQINWFLPNATIAELTSNSPFSCFTCSSKTSIFFSRSRVNSVFFVNFSLSVIISLNKFCLSCSNISLWTAISDSVIVTVDLIRTD